MKIPGMKISELKIAVMTGLIAGFVGAVVGGSSAQGAPKPAKIGYVTVPAVIQSTPAGGALKKIDAARAAEAKPVTEAMKKLQPKMRSGNATFEERDQWDKLSKRYGEIAKKYDAQFQKILAPFDKKLVNSIRSAASKQGFSLIVDGMIATDSGLLLYANQDAANITNEVIAEFKKLK
jgi:Skp family chaperone for outer membrane proteins